MAKKRGNTYHLRMRTPKRFLRKDVETRIEVSIALGTDSPSEAKLLEPAARTKQIAEWQAKLNAITGGTPAVVFQGLSSLAAASGLSYKSAAELAEDKLDEILRRVAHIDPDRTAPVADVMPNADLADVAAVLGGSEKPKVMLSELVAIVEELPAVQHRNRHKSTNKMRLWRNPRLRAVSYFMRALAERDGLDPKQPGAGDKPVLDVTVEDAWAMNDWWQARIRDEKLAPETANKDFNYISKLITDYQTSLKIRTPTSPFSRIRVPVDVTEEEKSKLPLPDSWIEEVLIAPHPLLAADMSPNNPDGTLRTGEDARLAEKRREAHAIAVISAETGCRQSEVHDLLAKDIRLSAAVPHFLLRFTEAEVTEDGERKGGRSVKNRPSIRPVILVGHALEAMSRYPEGFPTFRDKSSYSGFMNSWLSRHDLFPKPGAEEDEDEDDEVVEEKYTIGGTRHSFENRMKDRQIHTDDRGEMMGHSIKSARNREIYGGKMPNRIRRKIALMISFGDVVTPEEREEISAELTKLWQLR